MDWHNVFSGEVFENVVGEIVSKKVSEMRMNLDHGTGHMMDMKDMGGKPSKKAVRAPKPGKKKS